MKKKLLTILLTGALVAGVLSGCGQTPPAKDNQTKTNDVDTKDDVTDEADNNDVAADTETDATSAASLPAEGKLKTGQGVVTKISSSKAATEEAEGTAQVDSAIASVTYDSNGVIVKCELDAAQTKVSFDTQGEVTSDLTSKISTKVELGADYGMIVASSIEKEWYEQIQAFADWTVGKTLEEVTGMQVKKVDDNHPAVPDVPELASSVSISVGDYQAAIEKAMTYGGYEFDEPASYTTGMGVITSIASSKSVAEDADGTGQVDSAIVTVTLDGDGKIVACVMDAAQSKVNFNAAGELTSDLSAEMKTKVELGDEYGMKQASTVGKEWYEQIQAYAEWTIGKTVDEVKGMQVKAVDDHHPSVPDVAELTSSVSISVGDYISAVEKAAGNAK